MKLLHRAAIALDALVRRFLFPKHTGKDVLILFQQLYGDAVVLQNSLAEYPKQFPGQQIRLLARPSVLKFMQEVLPLPGEISLEPVDFSLFLENYPYYRRILKRYRHTAGLLIVPGSSLSADLFSAASGVARRVGLVRSHPLRKPLVMALFSRIAYTEQVIPPAGEMMLRRHRRLLQHLGARDYRAGLPALLPQVPIVEGRYALLCPGASKTEKCWPRERYAEVLAFLTEGCQLPVHLCGSAGEAPLLEALRRSAPRPEQVFCHPGLSFSSWSSLVQQAAIVIGNDSASLHLAAASGRKAICITGVYDRFQFFPYDPELPADQLPVTLYREMPCAYCRTVGYDAGYGNGACRRRIQEGHCALCIDAISAEEICQQISFLLEVEL